MSSKVDRCQDRSHGQTLAPTTYAPDSVTAGHVRASRTGRKRAIVLVLVHVAVFLHILHWKVTGETVSPLEPSEAMYTVVEGGVNAGAVLLLLSLLSVFVLGRWFCGWACHLVALQDLCAWLMKKIGIRPRPLRSRALMLVPLGAGLFMFGMPAVVRAIEALGPPEWRMALTKTEFWETFPGPIVATITFLVAGFAMVYLLGAKGFCTYACPYGGLFGVADRFAPGRIRVTDACKGCGHCTATCTSNVQVAAEVARFKMVVDPGCMKCMDCVSVCPENALYFGFGRPYVSARGGIALLLTFLVATGVMAGLQATGTIGGGFRPLTAAGLGLLGAVAIGLLVLAVKTLRASPFGTQKRQTSFTTGEEVALFAIFALTLAIFVGLPETFVPWADSYYGQTPLLLSLGLAAITAFVAVLLVRVLRGRQPALFGRDLRTDGRLTGTGVAAAVVGAAWVLFVGHAGLIQYHVFQGDRSFRAIDVPALAWREDRTTPLATEVEGHVASARRGFERARALTLWGDLRLPSRLAGLALIDGHPQQASELLREAAEIDPDFAPTWLDLAHVELSQGRIVPARRALERAVELDPENGATRDLLLGVLGEQGDVAAAIVQLEDFLKHVPTSVGARFQYATLLLQRRDVDHGLRELEAVVAAEPRHGLGHFNLGAALLILREDAAAALPHLESAAELLPGEPDVLGRLAEAYDRLGRKEEATATRARLSTPPR